MRSIDFTGQMVLEYLDDFYEDLGNYFRISKTDGMKCILFIDRHDDRHNEGSTLPGLPTGPTSPGRGSTEKNFIFAGLFSYLVLAQQAIGKVCGSDVQIDFHKCTGWPLISAGMAGTNLPLLNMLKEAVLYPCEVEQANFLRMLDSVKEVMDNKLNVILTGKLDVNLDDNAYRRIIASTHGKTDDIISHIAEDFKQLSISF